MRPLQAPLLETDVFLRREAVADGVTDRTMARRVASGEWHRIRQGAYCDGPSWRAATAEQRHLILAQAVLRTTPGEVALSHTTALLAHGVDVWGADLSRVHVTRLDTGSKRCEPDVDHHVGTIDADEVELVHGRPVVVLPRSVVEHAGVTGVEAGLVSADHALHAAACSSEELRDFHERFGHWPGQQRVNVVVHNMDGRSESVGETRGRWLFRRTGLPAPQLQFAVYDELGLLVGRTDYWWEEQRVFGEFDGRVKYGRLLRPGELPGDAVFREKVREDRLRLALDARCGRLTWADLGSPRATGERFAHLLGVRPLWRWAG